MKMRQQGAGLLIPVLLVVTVAAFAVVVAASQSAGDIHDSDANADSLLALFIAETGIERQLKRFATGTACTALGDDPGTVPAEATHTITDLSTIGLGTTAYSITLVNGHTTDFAGAALPATRCRVPITGKVIGSNVTRTIHAIVDRNLLEGPDNPTFDNPITAGAPSGWTLDPVTAFANNGGPDGAAAACSRSAWLPKSLSAGGQTRRASGTVNVQATVTPGSVTNITYHRRLLDRGAGCPDLGGPGAGGFPCAAAGGGTEGTICFVMTGTGGAGTWTSANDNMISDLVGTAACPSNFNPAACATSYAAPYPTKASMNVTMTGATSIATFAFFMRVEGGGQREMFLDHLEVTNPTALGAAHVRVWRDCSTASCPP